MNPLLRLVIVALAGLSLVSAVACSGDGSAAQDDAAAVVGSIPFEDGEELRYALHGESGVIGHGTLTVTREGDQFVLEQRYDEASVPEGEKPTSDSSSVTVDVATLQPQSVERVIEGRTATDRYAAQYSDDGSSVHLTETRDQSEPKERTIEVPVPSYDNESSLWLWRTLPLGEDYQARYVSVNPVERTRQAVDLQVTGQQRISVPAGTFETWRLQIRNGRATRIAWINIEAPHEIVQWDNGNSIFRLLNPESSQGQ